MSNGVYNVCDVQEYERQLTTEKKVMEKELGFERLLKEQELQKREKEITEYKKQLESVMKQLKTDDQKLSAGQEVLQCETKRHAFYAFCID